MDAFKPAPAEPPRSSVGIASASAWRQLPEQQDHQGASQHQKRQHKLEHSRPRAAARISHPRHRRSQTGNSCSSLKQPTPRASRRRGGGLRDQLLGGQSFLAGDRLSLADLHLAPIFAYFAATPESGPILEDKSGLRGWWERMKARKSVTKTEPQLG